MGQKINISLTKTTRHHWRVVEISLIVFCSFLLSIFVYKIINPLSGKIPVAQESNTQILLSINKNNHDLIKYFLENIQLFNKATPLNELKNSRIVNFHLLDSKLIAISFYKNSTWDFIWANNTNQEIDLINIPPHYNRGLIRHNGNIYRLSFRSNRIIIHESLPFNQHELFTNSNTDIEIINKVILASNNETNLPWSELSSLIISSNGRETFSQFSYTPLDEYSNLNILRKNFRELISTSFIGNIRQIVRRNDIDIIENSEDDPIIRSGNAQIIRSRTNNTFTSNTSITPTDISWQPVCDKNAHSFISKNALREGIILTGNNSPQINQIINLIESIEISPKRINLCLSVDNLWKN